MEILMAWIFAAIPIGGVLALIYLVERIQQRLRDMRGGAE
jgi:TRAP-type C4-dicarboxylate transport system permease small subunit